MSACQVLHINSLYGQQTCSENCVTRALFVLGIHPIKSQGMLLLISRQELFLLDRLLLLAFVSTYKISRIFYF